MLLFAICGCIACIALVALLVPLILNALSIVLHFTVSSIDGSDDVRIPMFSVLKRNDFFWFHTKLIPAITRDPKFDDWPMRWPICKWMNAFYYVSTLASKRISKDRPVRAVCLLTVKLQAYGKIALTAGNIEFKRDTTT
uniref:Uncharacterized protein n=1 Tax=Glossina pallidipes TaxID=7398 RepID=A0A1A9ZQ25_GLOPL